LKVKEGPPAIAVTGHLSVLMGGDLPPTFRRVIDGSGGLLRIDARVRKTRAAVMPDADAFHAVD
jgi:xanthosine utilization system XapX-like protein